MALSSIRLEDDLVPDGADHIEEEEDSTDRYVLIDGGTATGQGNTVREVWRLQARQSLSLVKGPLVVAVTYPRRASLACLNHGCHDQVPPQGANTLSTEMTF